MRTTAVSTCMEVIFEGKFTCCSAADAGGAHVPSLVGYWVNKPRCRRWRFRSTGTPHHELHIHDMPLSMHMPLADTLFLIKNAHYR